MKLAFLSAIATALVSLVHAGAISSPNNLFQFCPNSPDAYLKISGTIKAGQTITISATNLPFPINSGSRLLVTYTGSLRFSRWLPPFTTTGSQSFDACQYVDCNANLQAGSIPVTIPKLNGASVSSFTATLVDGSGRTLTCLQNARTFTI